MSNTVHEEIKADITFDTLIAHFAGKRNFAILESVIHNYGESDASFIMAEPSVIIKSKGDSIEIYDMEDNSFQRVQGDPFTELEALINRMKDNPSRNFQMAVGYFGYDLCHFIEKLPRTATDDIGMPDMYFGFYDCIFMVCHSEGRLKQMYSGASAKKAALLKKEIMELKSEKGGNVSTGRLSFTDLRSNFTKADYIKAVEKAKEYIYSGDIYQVNLSQRFQCKSDDSPLQLYMRLREISPAPFSGLISFNDCAVISSSPERFFCVKGRDITTRPIKGTRSRGLTEGEDRALESELMESEKDNAELAMIVDLERNDLGKICEYGSVVVSEPKVLEKYETVMHLVSTVNGKLKEGVGLSRLLKAVFPGGSITGCPKVRSMEIIDELEPTQRNAYTGALGYIDAKGVVDMSIAIRIFMKKGDNVYFQVGGGIVADSEPEKEYEETMIKGKALIKTLTGVSV